MLFRNAIKKRTFIVLFFYLSSCTSSPQWYLAKTITCDPCFNSGRMYFASESCNRGLELEIDQGLSGLRMYINVSSFEVPPISDTCAKAKVAISICGEETLALADIFQGGQRLLLPDDARDLIIESLQEGNTVTLKTGRYCAEIPPAHFAKAYNELIILL